MNDFTKDELQVIYSYVLEINRKYETTDEMELIKDKIQSMIENYCRHVNSNISFYCEDCELVL